MHELIFVKDLMVSKVLGPSQFCFHLLFGIPSTLLGNLETVGLLLDLRDGALKFVLQNPKKSGSITQVDGGRLQGSRQTIELNSVFDTYRPLSMFVTYLLPKKLKFSSIGT